MDDNFSPRVKDVITYSKEEALRLGHDFIGTEHLMLGILRDGNGKAISILNNLSIDLEHLRKKVEILSPANPNVEISNEKKNLHLTRQAERALKTTFLEAKVFQSSSISTAHLLLCILRNENDPTTKLLHRLKIDYNVVKEQYLNMTPNEEDFTDNLPRNESYNEDSGQDDSLKEGSFNNPANKTNKKSKTPVLDNFGRDLTELAEEGKLDPVVGREKEIERVSQILSRRKKNNPLLIGEPGVGKSAIAEGLALRIIQKKVSRILFHKRVVTLDLASLVAGTKYRGQFEERMKAIMNELEKNRDVILFIDEISKMDIMDFLKLDKYLRQIMAQFNPEALNYPFGGLNIVFCGDFSQLNPVGKKDVIYDQTRNALWGMINRVVNLTMTNWRFLKDQQWGNLLQRMHHGEPTRGDMKLINSRVVGENLALPSFEELHGNDVYHSRYVLT